MMKIRDVLLRHKEWYLVVRARCFRGVAGLSGYRSIMFFLKIQGLQTLSVKSNFDVRGRKIGEIFKVKVFSCSLIMHNLF